MDHRVIIMHGLDNAEMDLVMRAVKKTLDKSRDTIFAKTTDNSLKMKVKDLIEDLSEDHQYLKENPPEELQGGKKPDQ
jgi:Txe/YoeB family toxin of Txe-Axe toxin-antitoxin module